MPQEINIASSLSSFFSDTYVHAVPYFLPPN